MYFSAPGGVDLSSGADTFLFFDHFDGDLSKWTGDTTYAAIASSILTYTGADNGEKLIFGNVTAGSATFAVRAYAQIITAPYPNGEIYIGAAKSDMSHYAILYEQYTTSAFRRILTRDGATSSATTDGAFTADAYKTWDLLVRGGTNVRLFENGVESAKSPKTTNPPNSNAMGCVIGGTKLIAYSYTDWILLRKYTLNEPTWGVAGRAEACGNRSFFLRREDTQRVKFYRKFNLK
jgi:hypothetical protein